MRLSEQSKAQNQLGQNQLSQQIARDEEAARSNLATEGISDRNATTAKRRVEVEESMLEAELKSKEASAIGNYKLAEKYAQDAALTKTQLEAFEETGDGRYIGLPNDPTTGAGSEAQERLRQNDASNAELEITGNASEITEPKFKVLNKKFLENTPDSTNYFYAYDYDWGNEAVQVPLANGKTLGDVKAIAKKQGITLQQALDAIYKASKKKK